MPSIWWIGPGLLYSLNKARGLEMSACRQCCSRWQCNLQNFQLNFKSSKLGNWYLNKPFSAIKCGRDFWVRRRTDLKFTFIMWSYCSMVVFIILLNPNIAAQLIFVIKILAVGTFVYLLHKAFIYKGVQLSISTQSFFDSFVYYIWISQISNYLNNLLHEPKV